MSDAFGEDPVYNDQSFNRDEPVQAAAAAASNAGRGLGAGSNRKKKSIRKRKQSQNVRTSNNVSALLE